MEDMSRTKVHKNVALWVVAVKSREHYSDMNFFLELVIMTANGQQSMTLQYKVEGKRNVDHERLLEWLEEMK